MIAFEKDENINLLDEVASIYNNLFNEDISVLDQQEDEYANKFTNQIANLPGSSVTDIVTDTEFTNYEGENSENIGNNYIEDISTHSGEIKRVLEQCKKTYRELVDLDILNEKELTNLVRINMKLTSYYQTMRNKGKTQFQITKFLLRKKKDNEDK